MTTVTITDDYQSVRPLLYQLCRRFHARHGGEWDELVSEANECFTVAWHSYQPAKGKLTTWVHWKVWHGLLEGHRSRAKQHSRRIDLDMARLPSRKRFDLHELVQEVSDDAAAVIELTVGTPMELLLECRCLQRKPKASSVRAALVDFLLDTGWSAARILETFREIREVLS